VRRPRAAALKDRCAGTPGGRRVDWTERRTQMGNSSQTSKRHACVAVRSVPKSFDLRGQPFIAPAGVSLASSPAFVSMARTRRSATAGWTAREEGTRADRKGGHEKLDATDSGSSLSRSPPPQPPRGLPRSFPQTTIIPRLAFRGGRGRLEKRLSARPIAIVKIRIWPDITQIAEACSLLMNEE